MFKILIVEDNRTYRESLKDVLDDVGDLQIGPKMDSLGQASFEIRTDHGPDSAA